MSLFNQPDVYYCANCGEYRVEEVGQHCSKQCDMEFWADMNRDEN